MIEQDIETALFERVASLTLSPVLPVAWPNVNFTPPDDGKYLEVSHFPNGVSRYALGGGNASSRIGLLQLTVVTPLNQGPANATAIAGEVAAHFNDATVMFEGVAKVFVTKAPELAPAIKSDVSWSVPVTISYECNSA